MDREEAQKKKKPKFNAPSALNITSPRPYIASAAAPTSAEIQDVDAVIVSKEGCAETMAQTIEAELQISSSTSRHGCRNDGVDSCS